VMSDTPEPPATVLDAVRMLEADGYGASFTLDADGVHCGVCGADHLSERAEVVKVYRFEGESNPDDEAAVYALRCPACDAKGTLVTTFGPGADPRLADALVMLDTRFRESPTPPA